MIESLRPSGFGCPFGLSPSTALRTGQSKPGCCWRMTFDPLRTHGFWSCGSTASLAKPCSSPSIPLSTLFPPFGRSPSKPGCLLPTALEQSRANGCCPGRVTQQGTPPELPHARRPFTCRSGKEVQAPRECRAWRVRQGSGRSSLQPTGAGPCTRITSPCSFLQCTRHTDLYRFRILRI